MQPSRRFLSALSLACILSGAALALLPGCGTLDPSGPYKGDKVLYDFDATVTTSYTAIDSFLKWETQYRGTAAVPIAATKAADDIRARAPGAFRSALAVRDAYVGNKAANANALTAALGMIQVLSAQAVAQMTAAGTLGTAPPGSAVPVLLPSPSTVTPAK